MDRSLTDLLTADYGIRNFISGSLEMITPVLRHLYPIRTLILGFCHLLAVCLSYVFISLRSLFHCATAPSGPGPPHYGCLSITLRFNTFGWTPLDERSSRRRDLYLTTHNTDKKDFHALGGVRPRNPNKPAAADPHIRERGHWNLCPAYRPKVCVYFSHHHMC